MTDTRAPHVLVGLMSGTSLDGISAAVVRFTERHDRVHAELLHFVQRPYDGEARTRLHAAMNAGSAREYCRLHADLGVWLGTVAREAIAGAGLSPADVHAVASHGQTLWHEPGHSTWQIGDASRIAEASGCAVIADFRPRDMAVGGQGAPLVPMADRLLFAHERDWRALQNIGGIGNVSVVPPIGTDAPVRAFDTGPGVVVVDGVVQRLFHAPYDRDGQIAASGRVHAALLEGLLALPYLREAPPKSTGRELFSAAFIDRFIADGRAAGATPADLVATAVAFTAETMADQYVRFVTEPVTEVLLSGGGARNPALRGAIDRAFDARYARAGRPAPTRRLFDTLFFDAEAKEAVAFALLGYLHLTGRAGNVPSATGARAPRTLGALTPVR